VRFFEGANRASASDPSDVGHTIGPLIIAATPPSFLPPKYSLRIRTTSDIRCAARYVGLGSSRSLLVSQGSSESPDEVSRESIELRLKLMGVGEIGHHVYRELRMRVAAKTVIRIAALLLSSDSHE